MAGQTFSSDTEMKSLDSDAQVGIVSWDYGEQARGGLGRAMAEMAICFCGTGLHLLARKIRTVSVFAPCSPVPQRTNHIVQRLSRTIQCIIDSRFLFIVRLFRGLQQWIDTHQIRTVILPTGPGGLFLVRKLKRCRLIVVCYHTYSQQARMVPGQWWKSVFIPLERRTFRLADQVLCYSPDTECVLLQQYGVHRTKLTLLPQIFDVVAWHPRLPTKERGLCVCVARLDRRKGIDVLLRAWPSVVGTWSTARLVIVGDGRGRTHVLDFSAHHSSVRWIPSLPQEELVRLVQRAEIALCPSYLEGFGLACAEAMAAGTAVIASDCDGLRSLVSHGETGWLVPSGDHVALTNGITTLLRDAVLRERLMENAHVHICRSFSRQESTQQFLATFRESPVSSVSC
ncbi:glycosyltransferase family 4 protein, partial [Candidatus Peregrinibacteria bacterium]|nr:glycosyltransferase family 4 protein [Candidatus Peregrinibacteria bacterium]